MKVYCAKSMSGLIKRDLVYKSWAEDEIIDGYGIHYLDPVVEENIQPTNEYLFATYETMQEYWPRDKQLIREAHVVFDMTPTKYSEGRNHELGLARYCYWKPVVRVFPEGEIPWGGSIAHFEDDVVVDSLDDACVIALRRWGTRRKRVVWRLKMLSRCLPRWISHQIMFLFQ